MRYWECVEVGDCDRGTFTIGKIYETDYNGYNMKTNNGYELNQLSVICKDDFGKNKFKELRFVPITKDMKIKLGDKLKIIKNRSDHCFELGDIVKVTQVCSNTSVKCDDKTGGWLNPYTECELLEELERRDFYEIKITSDGVTTKCEYRKNNELLDTSIARLNLNDGDLFSMKTGSLLCIDRVFEEKYNKKIVCITNNGDSGTFTLGKIYEVIDGKLKQDNGSHIDCIFKSVDKINKELWCQFIELVE